MEEWQRDANGLSLCVEGEMTLKRIINNYTLLGHDVERHDPKTVMMASKIVGKTYLI